MPLLADRPLVLLKLHQLRVKLLQPVQRIIPVAGNIFRDGFDLPAVIQDHIPSLASLMDDWRMLNLDVVHNQQINAAEKQHIEQIDQHHPQRSRPSQNQINQNRQTNQQNRHRQNQEQIFLDSARHKQRIEPGAVGKARNLVFFIKSQCALLDRFVRLDEARGLHPDPFLDALCAHLVPLALDLLDLIATLVNPGVVRVRDLVLLPLDRVVYLRLHLLLRVSEILRRLLHRVLLLGESLLYGLVLRGDPRRLL